MAERWTGIKKLAEEMAELATVLAKLEAYPDGQHPDEAEHGPLIGRIEDEMADVYAALDYFVTNVNPERVRQRRTRKGVRFRRWRLPGIEVPDGAAPVQHCAATVWVFGEVEACGQQLPCRDHRPGCGGYGCRRDGECPEHGKDRPGQCVTVES